MIESQADFSHKGAMGQKPYEIGCWDAKLSRVYLGKYIPLLHCLHLWGLFSDNALVKKGEECFSDRGGNL